MGKKLVCPICGDIFSSNGAFYDHISDHENDEELADAIIEEAMDIKARFESLIADIGYFNDTYSKDGYKIEVTRKVNGDWSFCLNDNFKEGLPPADKCNNKCGDKCKCKDNKKDDISNLLNALDELSITTKKNSKSFEDFLKENVANKPKKSNKSIDNIDISDFEKKVVEPFIEDPLFFEKFFSNPFGIIIEIEKKFNNYVKSKGLDPNSPEAKKLLDKAIDELTNS